MLRGNCFIEGGIREPSSGDIAKIALWTRLFGHPRTPGQGLNRDIIQTLASLLSSSAKSFVQSVGNIADGVLHASIVGNAGIKCKHVGCPLTSKLVSHFWLDIPAADNGNVLLRQG